MFWIKYVVPTTEARSSTLFSFPTSGNRDLQFGEGTISSLYMEEKLTDFGGSFFSLGRNQRDIYMVISLSAIAK